MEETPVVGFQNNKSREAPDAMNITELPQPDGQHQNHIAIVGDGAGALIFFSVLCEGGIPAEAITIYGTSPHPLANLEHYARAVRQQSMRSESVGHMSPYDFPALALRESWQRRNPLPLLASLFDLYNPSLDFMVAHSKTRAEQLGFTERKVAKRIGAVEVVQPGSPPDGVGKSGTQDDDTSWSRFRLFDINGHPCGAFRHVVLALGYSDLCWPPIVLPWRSHPHITHAYEPWKVSEETHVVVIGGGIGAAHVWIAALNAGARVTALHRRPLHWQRLNTPRCDFTTIGTEALRSMPYEDRMAYLHRGIEGTYPRRWWWEWQLWRARQSGHFVALQGELADLQPITTEVRKQPSLTLHLTNQTTLYADQLICATGLQADARSHPLVDRLVSRYGVPYDRGLLLPDDDFTLSPISQTDSVCAVAGVLARWAMPAANTFSGIKYAARRLAPTLGATINPVKRWWDAISTLEHPNRQTLEQVHA